jgi:hypothetical protein
LIKKAISFLLLLLFMFNLIGYRLLVYYGQQQADLVLEASFDTETYQQKDVFTISIPLNLPYSTNWKNFERFDGEVTYKGEIYKYIKRKVYNNQLLLVCMPNIYKMRLENAKNTFFKTTVNEQTTNSKKTTNHKNDIAKKLTTDYDNFTTTNIFRYWQTFTMPKYLKCTSKLYATYIATPTQPPQIG